MRTHRLRSTEQPPQMLRLVDIALSVSNSNVYEAFKEASVEERAGITTAQ
jgi:hypothetical protein